MIYFIAVAAFFSTLLGGLSASYFRDKLHLVLGFSAGAVVGVAFFDLLPEAIELSAGRYDLSVVPIFIATGFACYMLVDRLIVFHTHEDEHCKQTISRGDLGAASLIIHSLFDGLAIGLAFQVSVVAGLAVATAVLAHSFSDGLNAVGIVLRSAGSKNRAYGWLILDALAAPVGIVLSSFLSVPGALLGLILAFFCGTFLYIGAGDLLPESHHRHPTHWTTLMTVIGLVTLYFIISSAGV